MTGAANRQRYSRIKSVKRWMGGKERRGEVLTEREYRSFVAGFDMGFKAGMKAERAMNGQWIWMNRAENVGKKVKPS